MGFEVYRPRTGRGQKKPQAIVVSLSKNSVVLNKPARETLQNPEFLELAFDNESGTIRIRPAAKGEGVEIKKSKVSAKGFLDHFSISNYGKHIANFNKEENAIFVNV
jgi:hypothetical protein